MAFMVAFIDVFDGGEIALTPMAVEGDLSFFYLISLSVGFLFLFCRKVIFTPTAALGPVGG